MTRLFVIESPAKRLAFPKSVLDNPLSRGTILKEICGERRKESNEIIHVNWGTTEIKELSLLVDFLMEKPDVMIVEKIKSVVAKSGPLLRTGIDIDGILDYYMVENKLEATRLILKGLGRDLAKIIVSRNRSGEKWAFRRMLEEVEKRGKDIKVRDLQVLEMIRNWCFGGSNSDIKETEIKKDGVYDQRNFQNETSPQKLTVVEPIEVKPVPSRFFRRKASDSSLISPTVPLSPPDPSSVPSTSFKSFSFAIKQLTPREDRQRTLCSKTEGFLTPQKEEAKTWRKNRIQSAIIDLPRLQQNFHEQSLLSLSSTPNESKEQFLFKPDNAYRERMANIIKTEAVIRGYIVRKEFSIKNLLQRKNILQEIVQTEENLCKNMKLMDKYFRVPLRDLVSKGLLASSQIEKLFNMSFDQCIHNSEENSNRLRSLYDQIKYDTLIGDGLNESFYLVTSLLIFTTDYNISLKSWKEIKKNKCVVDLIENNLKIVELENRTLEQLLIQPVQRTMRYPMLINELIKATKKTHKDFTLLKKSFDEYHFFSKVVDERTKMRDDLQRICEELDKPQYFIFGRMLISEYKVEIKEQKKKSCTVYLCNDIILIKRGKSKDKFTLEEFPLNGNVIADVSNRSVTVKEFRNEKMITFLFESNQSASVFCQIVNGTILDGWYVLGDDRSYGKLLESFIE